MLTLFTYMHVDHVLTKPTCTCIYVGNLTRYVQETDGQTHCHGGAGQTSDPWTAAVLSLLRTSH